MEGTMYEKITWGIVFRSWIKFRLILREIPSWIVCIPVCVKFIRGRAEVSSVMDIVYNEQHAYTVGARTFVGRMLLYCISHHNCRWVRALCNARVTPVTCRLLLCDIGLQIPGLRSRALLAMRVVKAQ